MSEKTYNVHVDGNRVFPELELPDDVSNVGEFADAVAKANAVAGTEFSFKADGDVAKRSMKVSAIKDGVLLELVEVTEPAEAVVEADEGDDTDPLKGKVADILERVGDDRALAQELLDAESAAEKPRSSLIEGLTKVVEADEGDDNPRD